MTTQDAYDKIHAHFHRPGARLATGTASGSMYRLGRKPEGRACAVGCLIPNELYDPRMDEGYAGVKENKFVRRVLHKLGFRSTKVFDFLADAQVTHDDSATVRQFREELDELARDYGLEVAKR